MKEYYRIGETASLMGITTQTLRFGKQFALSFEEYAYSYMKQEQVQSEDAVRRLRNMWKKL